MSSTKMNGRVFLVTGATDGIGKHTARRLAQAGATVLLHGRSPEKLQRTLAEIRDETGNESLETYTADLASLEQVRGLSAAIHARHRRLDVLVNNAGVFMPQRALSQDGHEMTFAVNVLAPFLLTTLLLDLVRAGRQPRVVHVSSISHLRCDRIDFEDLTLRTDYGDGRPAYALSKLCEIMYTYRMARLLEGHGVTVNCLDPGTVNTNMLLQAWGPVGIPVDQANFQFRAATDPQLAGVTGKYFVDDKDTRSSEISYDEELQAKLWDVLVDLTGARF